jgi:AAA-like domain/CHAT domain
MKIIMILSSNPKGTSVLDLEREIRDIREGLQRSQNREQFKIEQRGAARVKDLRQGLLDLQPTIIHFCGHGTGERGLVFEDDGGNSHLVTTEALSSLFAILPENIECVLLNACYAEVQAKEIVQHINYVIGMQTEIRDDLAIAFTQGFYDGVGAGKSIDVAFQLGCNAIQGEASKQLPSGGRKLGLIDYNANTSITEIHSHLIPVLHKKEQVKPPTRVILETPEGQVPIDSCFYVPSPYEDRCHAEIRKPGSLIRIKSPRSMGKSSLMARVLAQADQLGYRTVTIDLDKTNQKFFGDLDKYMQWFCASVGKPLGVRVKIEEYWDDIFGANDNSTDYFEKYLLNDKDSPLVLAIDNFDRVFDYADIETDFCGLLRGWHESSKIKKQWSKLRLIIVHSLESYAQRDINQSPFNVGLPIDLGEFTPSQIKKLVELHMLNWGESQLERLMKLIGGHPYLVRSALYHIAFGDLSLTGFLQSAPTEAGIYKNYLLEHLKTLEKWPELGAAMKIVVNSKQPVKLRSEEAFKLDSMGLVVRVENNVMPRCELYRQYFRDRLGG